jgi:protease-4
MPVFPGASAKLDPEVPMFVLGLKSRSLQQIAVIEMEGAIGPRLKAPEYARLLRSLEENDRIRAVVLDIDSPGGSATGSNYLYLSVKSLAERKPVVAFIRGIGASGAYLLSCPANRIITIPSALIGSIGVISARPLLHEALDRIGVRMNVTKSDRLKDMGSMFREPTEEEKLKELELVTDLYDQFLDAVAESRHMERAKVREVATGEVFTGRRSLELGLVDEIGDLDHAIDVAAELADAPRHPVWLHPRRNLREVLSTMIATAFVGEIATRVEESLYSRSQYYFQHRL